MTPPPVLLIGFNRPDLMGQVIDAIRPVAPPRVYLAVDGPRADRPDEARRVAEVRALAERLDWECEVQTLFREANRGCRRGVSEAITWFFENEEAGIILEDDCVPHPDFFPFCAQLLDRYRDDERVMAISGDNFQRDMGDYTKSYYFSIFMHVWGWATWRRAWVRYDAEAETIDAENVVKTIDRIAPAPGFTAYWTDLLLRTKSGEIDTWDYLWGWSCWREGGLIALPRVNMISNIGFGPDATHTLSASSPHANLATEGLQFPLRHPDRVAAHARLDAQSAKIWDFRKASRRGKWIRAAKARLFRRRA